MSYAVRTTRYLASLSEEVLRYTSRRHAQTSSHIARVNDKPHRFCSRSRKVVVVLGHPGGAARGREKPRRCGASAGGRADLDYSEHYRDQSWKGHGRVSANREVKLYGEGVKTYGR